MVIEELYAVMLQVLNLRWIKIKVEEECEYGIEVAAG